MSAESLEKPYDLAGESVESYRRCGHVLLREVADESVLGTYRPRITDYVKRKTADAAPLEERDAYHKSFLQVANLWEEDAAVRPFVVAQRFARIAAELMGVPAVRLYHDQALFKEPGGSATSWHQDQYYWPLDTDNCITMWMPLVDVPVEMGVLTFASGSHAGGLLLSAAISEESDAGLDDIVRQKRFPIEFAAMKAGDATFHSGWTVHRAPPNHTSMMREVMTVIYFADGARLVEPDNPHRPADLARWFPNQKPGELAGGPLTPIVYSS
jgi:ectoine hydroxylase-related dioxygenase (phytanoyl-CoA dioxygenase family)